MKRPFTLVPVPHRVCRALHSASPAVLASIALAVTGCGDSHSHGGKHDHDSHAGHSHVAPHGGTLVMLGDHALNIEFVQDPARGVLSAYILDAHAENFVRLPLASFAATAQVNGKAEPLVFNAVANDKTGEKVGETSQFDAKADWIKSAGSITGVVTTVEIRGQSYSGVPFVVTPPKP